MDNDTPVFPPRDAGPDGSEERQVARFLADNPDWLATRTDLYGTLSPPRRVHGEALADHMAAMIEAARQQAADMTAHAAVVLQAGRAAVGLAERTRAAVLALIRTHDVGEWLASDLPGLLGIDSAQLCVETSFTPAPGRLMTRAVAPGTLAMLLGRRDVRLRAAPPDAALLHGEVAGLARHDALLRVPARGMPPMLLALASRDAAILDEGLPASVSGGTAGGGGEAALAFLGEALAARIEMLAHA